MYNENTIKELERIAGEDRLGTITHTMDFSGGKRSGYYGCWLHEVGKVYLPGFGNTPEEAIEKFKSNNGIAG